MTLPTQLAKAAEAAADEHTQGWPKYPAIQLKHVHFAFEAGVSWLYAHLTAQAAEFDEAAAERVWTHDTAGIVPTNWGDMLNSEIFALGARWAYQQSSAREAALRADMEFYRTELDETQAAGKALLEGERALHAKTMAVRLEQQAEIARLTEQVSADDKQIVELYQEVYRLRAEAKANTPEAIERALNDAARKAWGSK